MPHPGVHGPVAVGPAMTVDEQTSRPLYRQVADALRSDIQEGVLPPGGQLPTEAALMDRHRVSRNTIRLALGVLRTEGLVITGQGRGSFVAQAPDPQRTWGGTSRAIVTRGGSDVLADELTAVVDLPSTLVTVTAVTAPTPVLRRLRLDPDALVVARHRLHMREEIPSHATDTYIPAAVAGDGALAKPGPLPVSIAEALDQVGHAPVRVVDDVAVRMPTPIEAQELRIATGVPVLAVQRTAFDCADTPVVTLVVALPGDRHTVRYALDLDTGDAGDEAGPGR